jgi:hypothetical protein
MVRSKTDLPAAENDEKWCLTTEWAPCKANFTPHKVYNKSLGTPRRMTTLASELSSRKCERCGAEMKLLGRLPRRMHQAPKMVFRCSNCDNVVQEQGDPF